ncbi:MAG: hypothetical protein JW847_08750 [Candidatus Omnitrophica bacterium]|nr:hypothetical protein [Candidatus Omnitrophota bacterium]
MGKMLRMIVFALLVIGLSLPNAFAARKEGKGKSRESVRQSEETQNQSRSHLINTV